MQHELACDRICADISHLLLALHPPKHGAAYAAALATRNVAAALHQAPGLPHDPRWSNAIAGVDRFLDYCGSSDAASPELAELRAFVDENADLLPSHIQRRRAG